MFQRFSSKLSTSSVLSNDLDLEIDLKFREKNSNEVNRVKVVFNIEDLKRRRI